VLFDLDLALADRSARQHALDLAHHLTKASEAFGRAGSDYARERCRSQSSAVLAKGAGCIVSTRP
jgi:hypothetical protein